MNHSERKPWEQIRFFIRACGSPAIKFHNFLVAWPCGTREHFVTARALQLRNLRAAILRNFPFFRGRRKNRTLSENRYAKRFPKPAAFVSRSPPGEKCAQQKDGNHEEQRWMRWR